MRYFRVAIAALLVVFSVLSGGGENSVAESAPYVLLHPSTFEHSPGWMQIASSFHDRVVNGTVFPSTWAASVPLAHSDLERAAREGIGPGSIPVDTLLSLPADGVVILVSSSSRPLGERANVTWWPPPAVHLRRGGVDRTWGPALGIPGVSFTALRGVVRGHISETGAWIEASVWFGSPMPSRQTVAIANAELNRLIIVHC